MSTTTYFVQARISADGLFADCNYFFDKAATQPLEGSTLRIPMGATACGIEQADGSELALLAASFKTLGQAPVMSGANFSAASAKGALDVPMPASEAVTKGVVLLFSNPGPVDGLYASADPEVTNSGGV